MIPLSHVCLLVIAAALLSEFVQWFMTNPTMGLSLEFVVLGGIATFVAKPPDMGA